MMTRNQKANRKSYCSEPLELIENYQQAKADNFAGWCIHHRREIQADGTRVSAKELIDQNLYFGRPANELVFMTNGEHMKLHHLGKHKSAETSKKMSESHIGKHPSEEHRKKLSEALSGENNPNFGKQFSNETRKKMSESKKGKNNWTKGTHWYNNGVKCIKAKTCPEGFVPGRLK